MRLLDSTPHAQHRSPPFFFPPKPLPKRGVVFAKGVVGVERPLMQAIQASSWLKPRNHQASVKDGPNPVLVEDLGELRAGSWLNLRITKELGGRGSPKFLVESGNLG